MENKIKDFIDDLRNRKNSTISEDATKTSIVLKLLNILNWNVFDNEEVFPEYVVEGKRVDYSLRHNNQNLVFIEVKKYDEELDLHQEQLLNYAFREGIEIAILTNGIAWWFYLPLNPGNWEQRKFFTIDFLKQQENEITKNIFDFLSKENVINHNSLETAKRIYKSNRKEDSINLSLPLAWNSLIEEPNELLVDLLNETNEKLCGFSATRESISEFLSSNRNQLLLSRKDVNFKEDKKNDLLKSKTLNRISENKNNYTGKKPISFILDNNTIEIKYWIQILIKINEFLYKHHRNIFEEKVLKLKGSKCHYYSKNKNELRASCRILDSNIYFESNFSTNVMVRFSSNLLKLFGYNGNLNIKMK